MARELDLQQAVELIQPADTIGFGLGPAQPPGLLRVMGERTDWTDLKVATALLAVGTALFQQPGVHYLSGFYGPFERALRQQGANISFAPADFRRFAPLLESQPPRVMATAASEVDDQGYVSLSLHAGGTIGEFKRAAADPNRLLIVESSPNFPRTRGFGDAHPHSLHIDEIDILVKTDERPLASAPAAPDEVAKSIAKHATAFVPDHATLQTGIGTIPTAIASLLAEGSGGGYGIHTEMFTDGLMQLHKAGKVSNTNKGLFDGVSVTTFAFGSQDLYDWLDDNKEVAFLPVEQVNDPSLIAKNNNMVTINGAIALDIHGQVVADTRDGEQFSGIGGAEDFIAGPGLEVSDRSLICLPATATVGDKTISRIVPFFGPGAVITTPRHQVDAVITEYGVAELEGLTVHQRGLALAQIAAPEFRDELEEAAQRASKGFSVVPQSG